MTCTPLNDRSNPRQPSLHPPHPTPQLTSVVQKHLVNLGIILAPQLHVVGFIGLAQVNAVKIRVTESLQRRQTLFWNHTPLYNLMKATGSLP